VAPLLGAYYTYMTPPGLEMPPPLLPPPQILPPPRILDLTFMAFSFSRFAPVPIARGSGQPRVGPLEHTDGVIAGRSHGPGISDVDGVAADDDAQS
jgi:hypothetical protein